MEANDWLQHHVNDVYDVIAAGPAGNIIVAGDLSVNKGCLSIPVQACRQFFFKKLDNLFNGGVHG